MIVKSCTLTGCISQLEAKGEAGAWRFLLRQKWQFLTVLTDLCTYSVAAATPAYDPRHLRAVSELVTVDSRDAYCSTVRLFVKSIAGDYKWVSVYLLLSSILI